MTNNIKVNMNPIIKCVLVGGFLEPTNHPDMIALQRFSDHITTSRR